MKNTKKICSAFALTLLASIAVSAQTTTPLKPTPTPVTKVETKPPAAALPKADELIDKFVAATGGEAAYKKQNTVYIKGTMEIPAMGIKGSFESYAKAPNKYAGFMKMPGVGDFAEIYDGSKGWASDPINGAR